MVDIILNGQGIGDVAGLALSDGKLNAGAMRPFIHTNGRSYVQIYVGGDPKKPESYKIAPINANGTLRRDEWKTLDEAILEISRTRLGGVEDLISNNLTYNLGNAMGTTVLEWHDINDFGEAEITMDGVSRSKQDRPDFKTNYLPIPIIHYDYEINARVLEGSRKLGNPLDTTSAERATRRVNEKLENMLFTNTTYTFGAAGDRTNSTIWSYLNHPDRNQVSMSTHWNDRDFDSDSATGPESILADVQSMKEASIAAKHYGPWMLYIPTAYETVMDDDYHTTVNGTTLTIRERILKLGGIKGIKVIDTLTADNVLLVQMTSDVVRLVRGMGLTNIQWKTEGDFVYKYKVLTIQVPQIRSDQAGNSGITHLA
jgi:hypothetical protein